VLVPLLVHGLDGLVDGWRVLESVDGNGGVRDLRRRLFVLLQPDSLHRGHPVAFANALVAVIQLQLQVHELRHSASAPHPDLALIERADDQRPAVVAPFAVVARNHHVTSGDDGAAPGTTLPRLDDADLLTTRLA